jgi:hypothetical protein
VLSTTEEAQPEPEHASSLSSILPSSFSAFASAPSIVATPSSDVVAEPAPEPLSSPSESTFLASVALPLSPAITPLSTGNVSEPEPAASSIPPSSSASYSLAPPSTIDVHEIASAPPAFLPLILYTSLGDSSRNPEPEPPPSWRSNPQRPNASMSSIGIFSTPGPLSKPPSDHCRPSSHRCRL